MRQTKVWERGRRLQKQFERCGPLEQVGTSVPTCYGIEEDAASTNTNG